MTKTEAFAGAIESIDELIVLETRKLETLKQLRKALVQQQGKQTHEISDQTV